MKIMIRFLRICIVIISIFFWFKTSYISYFTSSSILSNMFLENSSIKNINFNIKKDLVVFLHIPKTGGTDLEDKIIKNLTVVDIAHNLTWAACRPRPNVKYYYNCLRNEGSNSSLKSIEANWFFTRKTIGW